MFEERLRKLRNPIVVILSKGIRSKKTPTPRTHPYFVPSQHGDYVSEEGAWHYISGADTTTLSLSLSLSLAAIHRRCRLQQQSSARAAAAVMAVAWWELAAAGGAALPQQKRNNENERLGPLELLLVAA